MQLKEFIKCGDHVDIMILKEKRFGGNSDWFAVPLGYRNPEKYNEAPNQRERVTQTIADHKFDLTSRPRATVVIATNSYTVNFDINDWLAFVIPPEDIEFYRELKTVQMLVDRHGKWYCIPERDEIPEGYEFISFENVALGNPVTKTIVTDYKATIPVIRRA